MKNTMTSLIKDIENNNLPEDTSFYDKIHCELVTGRRIYWYYEADKEFFDDQAEDIKDHYNDLFSGIVVPIPNVENRYGEIDVDECVVIWDRYPVEKKYCETTWVSLKRILNTKELVEIVSMKEMLL